MFSCNDDGWENVLKVRFYVSLTTQLMYVLEIETPYLLDFKFDGQPKYERTNGRIFYCSLKLLRPIVTLALGISCV